MAQHAHRLLVSTLFFTVFIVGCTKHADTAVGAASSSPAAVAADVAHGKELYTQVQCSSCHAVDGSGGVGPNLHGEKTKKNLAATIAWIENPDPPMPKLYPSPLSASDVRDVAAFVETL
jgi:mono/diheme cytochrome c family protein